MSYRNNGRGQSKLVEQAELTVKREYLVLWKKQIVDSNELTKIFWDQGLTQTEILTGVKLGELRFQMRLSCLNRLYWIRRSILGAIKFVSFVVRLGFGLALIGHLKYSTLVMMGKAAKKSQKGIMSFSKYNRMLTSVQPMKK